MEGGDFEALRHLKKKGLCYFLSNVRLKFEVIGEVLSLSGLKNYSSATSSNQEFFQNKSNKK